MKNPFDPKPTYFTLLPKITEEINYLIPPIVVKNNIIPTKIHQDYRPNKQTILKHKNHKRK